MPPRRCCACISAPGSFMFLNRKLHLMSISFGVTSNQYFIGSPFQLHQDMDKLYHQCAQPSPTLVYPISNSTSQETLTYSIQTARVRTLSEASAAWRKTAANSSLPKAAGFSHCSSLPVPCSLITSPQTSTLHVTMG